MFLLGGAGQRRCMRREIVIPFLMRKYWQKNGLSGGSLPGTPVLEPLEDRVLLAADLWISEWMGVNDSTLADADEFIGNLLADPKWSDVVDPTVRLYSAYFLRRPDTSGLKYWVGKVRNQTSLDDISEEFAQSTEFKDRYGSLGNAEFVKLVYENVLAREPDNAGYLHWTYRLDHGKSRGWVMRQMCESPEYVEKTAHQVGVISAYLGLLERSPSDGDLGGWSTMARANSGAITVLIHQIRTGPEYRQRIASL